MKSYPFFIISFSLALLISGFIYYFAAPLNWGAGEYVLDFHLWIGILFTIYLIYSIPKHIKSVKARATKTIFIKSAYFMLFFLIVTIISGLAHFIPYISYFIKPIYYRFETYDIISTIHLISASLFTFTLVLHLSIKHKENR